VKRPITLSSLQQKINRKKMFFILCPKFVTWIFESLQHSQ
jgi:hypothetical protein